jgi:hypothetical protein
VIEEIYRGLPRLGIGECWDCITRSSITTLKPVTSRQDSKSIRRLDNVVATPHIRHVSLELYLIFYQDTVANTAEWLGRSFQKPNLKS